MGRAARARAGPQLADRGERLRDSRECHGGLVQPLCIFFIELEAGVQVVGQPVELVLCCGVDVKELILVARLLLLGLIIDALICDVDLLAPSAPEGTSGEAARERWPQRPTSAAQE